MWKIVPVFLIAAIVLISGCISQKDKAKLEALANCLAEKGVKEYGAFWCPNCAKQKRMFGPAYKIIEEKGVYVECDPRGENAQPELCLEKNIQGYPTWIFPDGTRLEGVQELKTLSEKANCNWSD